MQIKFANEYANEHTNISTNKLRDKVSVKKPKLPSSTNIILTSLGGYLLAGSGSTVSS